MLEYWYSCLEGIYTYSKHLHNFNAKRLFWTLEKKNKNDAKNDRAGKRHGEVLRAKKKAQNEKPETDISCFFL